MFPLYDTARSRRFPLMNWTLVILNSLVFYYELT
ncbi:MAG: rhomboid family intramembrane serine protease, partial [Chloroflexi bacterium CFX2]|nr:rhomboid family intramembrane serine protease [Chloroflexi bacterium CFX2]